MENDPEDLIYLAIDNVKMRGIVVPLPKPIALFLLRHSLVPKHAEIMCKEYGSELYVYPNESELDEQNMTKEDYDKYMEECFTGVYKEDLDVLTDSDYKTFQLWW